MKAGDPIPEQLLDRPVTGLNLAPGTLRGQLGPDLIGPAVWSAKSRAQAKGHGNGERMGDIWRMPGVFLVRESEILWVHEYRHAADHPDYQLICELTAEARGGSR